jgi:hypothetical protein
MRVKLNINLKIYAAVYIFLLCLCGAPCYGQVDFKISPPAIEINLGRGGTKVFSFELINDNRERPLAFKIIPVDVDMTREGNTEFRDAGTTPYSCSSWIAVEPKGIVVEPGQTKKIIGKISVPASAPAGGYYSAIACELAAPDSKSQLGSNIKWRIASLVKVTVSGGGLEKKAIIEDFFLRTLFEDQKSAPKGLAFVASVRNSGNTHVIADGKLIVLAPDRRRKGEVDFNMGTGTVLPGHTREFVAVYDRLLPEGQYIARVTFRYGGSNTLEKEIPFAVDTGNSAFSADAQSTVTVAAVRAVPDQINLKVPAGGFRTAGIALQNQRQGTVRISAMVDPGNSIRDWFTLAPGDIIIDSGKESKILLTVTVPRSIKDGKLQAMIIIKAAGISVDGTEEILDPINVGVNLEVPKI